MPMIQAIDMTGQRFGLLVALHRTQTHSNGRTQWVCRCDCGATCVKIGKYLRNGDTRSCGCVQVAQRARGNPKLGHGGATGGRLSRTYAAWRGMNERCYNAKKRNYRWYGGRGVEVHPAWRKDYAQFLRDMSECPEGLTLDRINPDGHYTPANCRWATWETQARDRCKPRLRKGQTPKRVAPLHAAAPAK